MMAPASPANRSAGHKTTRPPHAPGGEEEGVIDDDDDENDRATARPEKHHLSGNSADDDKDEEDEEEVEEEESEPEEEEEEVKAAVLERERRSTAGRRMNVLTGQAAQDDDAFWGHDTWQEEDADSGNESFHTSDEDSALQQDEFDSDFGEDDDEEEEGEGNKEGADGKMGQQQQKEQLLADQQDRLLKRQEQEELKRAKKKWPTARRGRPKKGKPLAAAGLPPGAASTHHHFYRPHRIVGQEHNAGLVLNLPPLSVLLSSFSSSPATSPSMVATTSVDTPATRTTDSWLPLPTIDSSDPAASTANLSATALPSSSSSLGPPVNAALTIGVPLVSSIDSLSASAKSEGEPLGPLPPSKPLPPPKSAVIKGRRSRLPKQVSQRAVSSRLRGAAPSSSGQEPWSAGEAAVSNEHEGPQKLSSLSSSPPADPQKRTKSRAAAVATTSPMASGMDTITKKRSREVFTQEQLLLEAANQTEPENVRWLLGRKRLLQEQSSEQSNRDAGRISTENGSSSGLLLIARFTSRRGVLNTITFPEMDHVPDILRPTEVSKHQDAPPTRCVITQKVARYRDPQTMLGYYDAAAYRELKRRKAAGEPLDEGLRPATNSPAAMPVGAPAPQPPKRKSEVASTKLDGVRSNVNGLHLAATKAAAPSQSEGRKDSTVNKSSNDHSLQLALAKNASHQNGTVDATSTSSPPPLETAGTSTTSLAANSAHTDLVVIKHPIATAENDTTTSLQVLAASKSSESTSSEQNLAPLPGSSPGDAIIPKPAISPSTGKRVLVAHCPMTPPSTARPRRDSMVSNASLSSNQSSSTGGRRASPRRRTPSAKVRENLGLTEDVVLTLKVPATSTASPPVPPLLHHLDNDDHNNQHHDVPEPESKIASTHDGVDPQQGGPCDG